MTGSGCSCQHSVLSPEDPSLELVQRQADTINPLCPWTVNTGGSISVHPPPPPPLPIASFELLLLAERQLRRLVSQRGLWDQLALGLFATGRPYMATGWADSQKWCRKDICSGGDIVVALHHSSFAIALFIAQHCQGSRSCFQPEERCVVDRCDRCPWGFHSLESHFLPDALGDFITQNTSILWLNLTMNQVFFRYFYAMVLQTTNRANN